MKNVKIYITKTPSNLKISVDPGKNSKIRAFNKAVGPGKKMQN